MTIENVFQLIEDNIDEADFCEPIGLEKIKRAEEILGVKFPKSYFMFLEKYGAGDIAGIEIYGIIKDPEIDGIGVPNGIWYTQNLRKEYDLPKEYVVVSETGYGPYYIIDTSLKNEEGESPVYMWEVGNQKVKEFDSFAEFFHTLLEESL